MTPATTRPFQRRPGKGIRARKSCGPRPRLTSVRGRGADVSVEPVPCRAGRGRGGRSRGAGERGAAARRCPAAGNPGGRGPAAPLTPASPSPRVQGQAEWREGEAQAAGSARHGAAPQAVALQAPRQPVPHQDREDPLGARLADDAGAGNRGGRAGPRRVRADLHLAPSAGEGWGGCRPVLVLPLPPQRMLRACRKRLAFLSILPINSALALGSGGVAWCFVGGQAVKSQLRVVKRCLGIWTPVPYVGGYRWDSPQ